MSFKLFWSLKKRAYLLDPVPRVVRRRGALWLLDPHDWLDLQLLIGRPFETRQITRLAQLCLDRGATRFFDIGANFGLYSVLLPRMAPVIGRVDAFEPVSGTRWRLAANLGLNGMERKVHVHAVALSDRTGTAEIAIDPGSTGVSTLSPSPDELEHRAFSRSERVELCPFDAYLPGLEGRLAFKIDVEGHELAVLGGLSETLSRCDCVLQVETRPRNAARVAEACAALGYHEIDAIDDDRFFLKRG
jgi:FkbM family methyltransferase